MALMECSIFSESLGMCTNVNVILPQNTYRLIGMAGAGSPVDCPVLYLLHGLSDDHSIWLRRTCIERYAAQFGIAVVMPNVHRSYYCDMEKTGLAYWKYVSEELPELLKGFFRFSTKREDTFVAGLSMGGYGSFKLALNQPERFAAAGCFSSVIRPWQFEKKAPNLAKEVRAIFGDDPEAVSGSINDIEYLAAEHVKNGTVLPEIYMACGTEDFLYQENTSYRDYLNKLGVSFTYHEEPGTHEWGFWDRQILTFLNLLKEKGLLKG